MPEPLGVGFVEIKDAGDLFLHHNHELLFSEAENLRVANILNELFSDARNFKEVLLLTGKDFFTASTVTHKVACDHASDAGDFTQRYLI
jgi:hypothetical protein